MIIEKGITYYLSRYAYEKQSFNKTQIFLSDSDHDVVSSCLESCYNNNKLMNFLYPKDVFGDKIESHCEDAFFIDFVVTYQHRHCATLRFKLKADNWTIDYDENKFLSHVGAPFRMYRGFKYQGRLHIRRCDSRRWRTFA
jgi:hypothetical protein